MEIKIKGYLAASKLLTDEPNEWDSLFIIDSGLTLNPQATKLAKQSKALYFDDIEQPASGKTMPSGIHIDQAIEFSSNSKKLLITCRAGQSRSAAIAFIIALFHFGAEHAQSIITPGRHRPNQQLLKLANETLDLPELHPTFTSWNAKDLPLDIDSYKLEMQNLLQQGIANIITEATC